MSSYRKTMRQALEEMHDMLNEAEDFKPHKMYDPKTGKAYDAKTMDDHLRMKKKGYDHEKPKDEDENDIDESLWANIAAKKARIKAGSGETMRKKGDPGAPTSDQMAKAKNEELDKDDESVVKKVVGKLKKASQAHAGQSKALEKALDEQETTPMENPVVKAQNKLKVVKKVADLKQQMAAVKKEEVELDEASKYDLYHKDFSSAMQHAYKMAKKIHGITISPDEISDKVATGPRKPSEGKTNKYRLEGDKGAIQVQVYNKGGSKPYELNFYKEEVELDEDVATMGAIVMGLNAVALLPVLFVAVREIIRGTPLESSIKKIIDKLKKNKNYKMSDSEKSDVTGFVSKVKKEKPSLFKKVMSKVRSIKEEVELDESMFAAPDKPTPVQQAHRHHEAMGHVHHQSAVSAVKAGYSHKEVHAHLDKHFPGGIHPTVRTAVDNHFAKKTGVQKNEYNPTSDEEVELDEAKMSSSQIAMLKKAYEPMRDKKIGVENADRLSKMMNKVARDKEALMQLFKADIPFVSQSAVTKLITKHGMKGAEINKLREGHEINEVLPFVVGAAARLAAPIITRKLAATGARKLATGAVRAATGVAKTAATMGAAPAAAPAASPSDDAQQERDSARAQAEKQRAADQAAQQDAAQRKAAAYNMTTEASAYSDARRAMASDPSTRQKFSKNISASDDDIKSADKNIIMQLRDVVSLKGVGKLTLKPSEEKKLKKSGSGYTKTAGSGFVEFANGRKEKIDLKIAQAILDKYNKQRKPSDKESFQAKISKSKKDMLKALKETIQIDKNRTSLSKVKNFMKENEEK